jgi:hypothetical protein
VWVVYHKHFDKESSHTEKLSDFEKWIIDTDASNIATNNKTLMGYTREHQTHIVIVKSDTDDLAAEIAEWVIQNVSDKWSFNTYFKQDSSTGCMIHFFETSFEDLQTATLFRLRF